MTASEMLKHRNVIRFDTDPPVELTLVSTGTLFPDEVVFDDEAWVRAEVVEWGEGFTVRRYEHSDSLTPSQRLFRAIEGGP